MLIDLSQKLQEISEGQKNENMSKCQKTLEQTLCFLNMVNKKRPVDAECLGIASEGEVVQIIHETECK